MKVDLLQQKLTTLARPRIIIGLGFEELTAIVTFLRKSSNKVSCEKSLQIPLPDDWLTNPEEVGRRLKDSLQHERIYGKKAIVLVDPSWLFIQSVPMPNISDDDLPSFVELQVERLLPLPPVDLAISYRKITMENGENRLVITALPVKRLQGIVRLVKGIGYEPISITSEWGLELNGETTHAERKGLVLQVRKNNRRVEIILSSSRMPLAYHSFIITEVDEQNSNRAYKFEEELFREIRLTIARLGSDLRKQIEQIEFIGGPEIWNGVREFCKARLDTIGIKRVLIKSDNHLGHDGRERFIHIVCGAATRWFNNEPMPFEFLPPRISRWQKLLIRYSQGKGRFLVEVGIGVVGVGILISIAHARYLSHLESKWRAIEPQVKEITQIQQNIKKFKPWFNDNASSLMAGNLLAEAFPEVGTIWAKIVQIKSDGNIRVTGQARDPQSLQDVTERLRKNPNVQEVKVQQVRGQSPIEFIFEIKLKQAFYGN